MANDYVRKRQSKQSSNTAKQFLLVIAAFIGGYLTATVFDFTSLSTWVNKNVLNQKNREPEAKIATKEANLPKPKFEFYTLLAKDNSAPIPINRGNTQTLLKTQQSTANIAATQASTMTPSLTPPQQTQAVATAVKPESYLIQVASFNKRQDAEHLKASLALKGFDVTIATVLANNINWFRVTIGPFHSRVEAEKAQVDVARSERMKGMIRKMDV